MEEETKRRKDAVKGRKKRPKRKRERGLGVLRGGGSLAGSLLLWHVTPFPRSAQSLNRPLGDPMDLGWGKWGRFGDPMDLKPCH